MLSVDFVIVIVFAVLMGSAAVVVLRALRGSEVQRESRRLHCPLLGRAAECVLVRSVRTGVFESVARCSLHQDGERAPCGSECLRLLELKGHPRPANIVRDSIPVSWEWCNAQPKDCDLSDGVRFPGRAPAHPGRREA